MKIVNITLNKFGINFNGSKNQYKSQYQMPASIPDDKRADEFIKQKVEEAKADNKEAYSNLANIKDKIPKNEMGADALNQYLKGEIDFDAFLKYCSLIHELYLLKGERSYDIDDINTAKILEMNFAQGGPEASNYEMAGHLIESGELHPSSLTFNKVQGSFNRQFVDDLDKIFDAKMNNKNPMDVFVPEFKNAPEAKYVLKTGEVCRINGKENLFMELKNGELEELFIKPETYLELFPPAQRFSLSQGATGDCFLISAFNSAYLNPNARHLILEMFKENPDGTLDVSIGGYKREKNGEVKLKNPRSYELKDAQNAFSQEDLENNFQRYVSQFEGFRVLEVATRTGSEETAYSKIKKHYEKYEQAVKTLENDDDYITIKGENYTKAEMQAFLDIVGDIDNKEVVLQTMVSLSDLFIDFEFGVNEARGLLKNLEKIKEKGDEEETPDLEYFRLSLKRSFDYAIKNNKDKVRLNFTPYNFYNELTGNDIDAEIDYIDGGTEAAVYRKMGLKTKVINTARARRQGEKFLSKIFADKDFNSKYIAGVSSFDNDRSKIIQAHAYSLKQIEQVNENGKLMYAFTNPHNGAREAAVNQHQLKKAFTNFEFALIE